MSIGYVPFTSDLSSPTDRFRFGSYLRGSQLPFVPGAPDGSYEAVVVSLAGDLHAWALWPKGRGSLIFDCVDPYMFTTKGSMSDRLRAAGKFLARDLSGFHSSFRDVLDAMFRRSDAVVCGSETQRDYIKTLCPNCFVILDDHEDSVHRVKTDYRRGEKLNLGWEGMLGNIQPFQSLIPDLKEVLQTQRAQFHVITQLESPRYLRRYGRVQATSVVRQSVPDFPASVYSWSPDTFSSIYTCSDIVLVPLPQGSSFHQAKSASKVLLAARMGLPILCSWSPAYQEFSELAGIPMVCKSASDWADKLQTLSESESMRQAWGEAARKAAESHYSSSLLRGQWKQVLESVRRSP